MQKQPHHRILENERMGNTVGLLSESLARLPWETIGVWVAALLTLAVYTYLAGNNPLYLLVQHVFVGMAVGYAVVVVWHSLLAPRVAQFMSAPSSYWHYVVFLVLGLALLSRAFPRFSWLGDVPLAYLFGVGAALSIAGAIAGSLIPQTEASMVPLLPAYYGGGTIGVAYALDRALVSLGAIAVLAYFYFGAKKQEGVRRVWSSVVGIWSGAGRWLIIVVFGALFASVAVGRIALLIGRLHFLLGDWLKLTGGWR